MSDERKKALSSKRRRRGVVRASLTHLDRRVHDLNQEESAHGARLAAEQLLVKLKNLDTEFRTYHFDVIDLIDEDESDSLADEQAILDEHDRKVEALTIRLQQVASGATTTSMDTVETASEPDGHRYLTRRLTHVRSNLQVMIDAIESTHDDTTIDDCLLHQYDQRLNNLETELSGISRDILTLDGDVSQLMEDCSQLDKALFDSRVKIRRLLQNLVKPTSSMEEGVKLPKIEVPTFDGNLVNWISFWEQFSISIHEKCKLTNAEKLTYLRHALKDGSAKQLVEGLSASGDQYEEAIDCLRKRFDRPRLLHQTHVRAILEAPSLREGKGKELRRLHDTVNQHLRALKAMNYDPPEHFITSMLELKLDQDTMFEWQRHTQSSTSVPPVSALLEFIDLRAQASESAPFELNKKHYGEKQMPRKFHGPRSVTSFTTVVEEMCVLCKTTRHSLYSCPKFKSLPHDQMLTIIKNNGYCMNCLKPGHFLKHCTSTHRCRRCQKPHHTLLHVEFKADRSIPNSFVPAASPEQSSIAESIVTPVTSHVVHACPKPNRQILLMTSRVLVTTHDGLTTQARALLDSASSSSFISDRLAQHLKLPRNYRTAQIFGIGGLSHKSLSQSVVHFNVAPRWSSTKQFQVEAIVLPKVTADLPLRPVAFDDHWQHLSGLCLADPDFGTPSNIDILLGIETFTDVLLHGRRCGPPGSPTGLETCFGWVLAGSVKNQQGLPHIISNHVSVHAVSGDELLQKFWEIEELKQNLPSLSLEERAVVSHFHKHHSRNDEGRFVVPLPRSDKAKPLGESRSIAVRRFLALERSLKSKKQFEGLDEVIKEYFRLSHAEEVPLADLHKPREDVFYLPVQAVVKESSSTTKIRAVFDASSKSSSGASLNDTLLVGPTVHSPLVDVLLRFRLHRVALTTDVSQMYRAIVIPEADRDLHRFVWRSSTEEQLRDYRMTRVTFGVASSSFAANMSVKQNAIDHVEKYPLAAAAVHSSFYVDDGLLGADSVEEAIEFQQQIQNLFKEAGFLLHKWKSSEPATLQHLPDHLLDLQAAHTIPECDGFAKTLGIEWSTNLDCFRLTIQKFPELKTVTKRALVGDVAKTYDVLGWFSPAIVKIKVLLQRLWEARIGWDDPVPLIIKEAWEKWRKELPLLQRRLLPRCHYPKDVRIVHTQLHGFSDASEAAYAGVVYVRTMDLAGESHVSLVMAKTKVAPLKRQSIPRLELCGANLLASLLHHVQAIFNIPNESVFAWTDSTVVLGWLSGSPRRFKTFVGNRVSNIMQHVPPNCWRHVCGIDNPADCASRGVFPSELLDHKLWWNGPQFLSQAQTHWPKQPKLMPKPDSTEEKNVDVSLISILDSQSHLPILNKYSNFTILKRITAWVLRFVNNCRTTSRKFCYLSIEEMAKAERYWMAVAQQSRFAEEIVCLQKNEELPRKTALLFLRPFIDLHGLLRVGGREGLSKSPYSCRHPVILPREHGVTKLLVQSEHLRLLHAGPTLMLGSLSRNYYILGSRRMVRSITRACVVCRRTSSKPKSQLMGQLPADRLIPGAVFGRIGVDYAGPVMVRSGSVRKPTFTKAYVCVFVCLAVKAVHLELVSDLTTEAFIGTLRRFVARRGKPNIIWSDNGTNFVGAARELKDCYAFANDKDTQHAVSQFCLCHGIQWKFIPERAPHFGGLWEASVKSMKSHLRKIVGNAKLNFEELTTVLTQVESCLNSRPICPLPDSDDGFEALTPGHFLIGRPLESIPDPLVDIYHPNSLLKRWRLCQLIARHFWQRWSMDYLSHLKKSTKWQVPIRNFKPGDLVCIHEHTLVPTMWPLARVLAVHPGQDGLVRVVTLKTAKGTFRRPIAKVALILPNSEN